MKLLDDVTLVRRYAAGESGRSLAAEVGCSESAMYARLRAAGVTVTRRARLDPDVLTALYESGESLASVAGQMGVAAVTVRSHLRRAGVQIRGHAESVQPRGRARCPASAVERARMLGFVWGDMAVDKAVGSGTTIAVRGSTTQTAQLDLIREMFGPFGPVYESTSGRATSVRVSLDLSFGFLLGKYESHPPDWTRSGRPAAAFAAGYIDAEGSFGVYDNRARFKVDSFDAGVHEWLGSWLTASGVWCRSRTIARAGDPRTGLPPWPRDLWRTSVNEALSMRRLVSTLEPFSRHARRRVTMAAASENALHRLRTT